MKRLFIFALLALILLNFSACGNRDNKKNNDTDNVGVRTDNDTEKGSVTDDTDNQVTVTTTTEPAVLLANAQIKSQVETLDREKIGYGCGTDYDSNNRSVGAQMMQDEYGEFEAYFINEPDNCIYLTFDEGYENGYTPQILDILKEKGVTATFFVTYDYASRNPDLIKRMIDEGHIVGNHSYTHPSMPELTVEDMVTEIKGLSEYIKDKFGYEMTTFRPPMGEFSQQSLGVAKALGYKSVFWSFAYKDWETENQPDLEDAYNKITSASHSGAIYLLHAVSSTNTAILGSVIEYWQDNGYTVKAFS